MPTSQKSNMKKKKKSLFSVPKKTWVIVCYGYLKSNLCIYETDRQKTEKRLRTDLSSWFLFVDRKLSVVTKDEAIGVDGEDSNNSTLFS